ncbi:chloride channel CLIC-like protein 1 [Stegodyphus dumicola]|uniref:chloride channel CLIC-like protein 1 n=1 Tax=Stegodyphus dumicola TaxID=202533 RepID=UPI0015A90BC6|nr:chloride channel CLIC-like protein 1 [Stegodyphus dumicola]
MSKLVSYSSWFLSIYLIYCVGYCCLLELIDDKSAQKETPFERKGESLEDVFDSALEMQRRREIAENYLKDLEKGKEHWVDPYDMLNYPDHQIVTTEQRHVANFDSKMKEGVVAPFKQIYSTSLPVKNEVYMDNDMKPMFSDIKGEVIGSNKFVSDGSTFPNNFKESTRISDGDKLETCILDSIYISRWIKKLIHKVEREASSESEINYFTFQMNKDFVDRLQKMLLSKTFDVGDLDAVISDFVSKAVITSEKEKEYLAVITYLIPFIWMFASISIILIVSYVILQWLLHHPCLTLFWFLVFISIMWHWMHLYKQKLAYKHAELSSMTVPSQCRKDEFGIIGHIQEYIKSYFHSNDCQKYYEALMVDPFWEVSFTVAASEAFAAMLFQPLSAASRSINSAARQLFDGLSIFTIIPLTIFLFLIIAMLFNYKIKFPFFMGSLEPSTSALGNHIEDLNSAKSLSHHKNEILNSISGKSNEKRMVAHASNSMLGRNESFYVPKQSNKKLKPKLLSREVCGVDDMQLYPNSYEELCPSHSSELESECTECKNVSDSSDNTYLPSDREETVDQVKEVNLKKDICKCSNMIKKESDMKVCDTIVNSKDTFKKSESIEFC